jgi:hypothetical protein
MQRTLIQDAEYVITQMEAFGCGLPADSRLMKLRDLLRRGPIRSIDEDFVFGLEAHRDFQQMAFVFDQMQGREKDTRLRSVLKHMKGEKGLSSNQPNTPGQDHQFELYCGAICAKAGLNPVIFEEPDVTFNVGRERMCLAAKRLKSFNPVSARITKAVDQIKRSRLPGLIAFEMSLAINPLNQVRPDRSPRAASESGQQFVAPCKDEIRTKIRGVNVVGIIVKYFETHADAQGLFLRGQTIWFDPYRANHRRVTRAEEVFRAFEKGIPHLMGSERWDRKRA